MLVNYVMSDSLGDGDGRFDAGEEILLYPVLRNTWGEAVGIRCSLATSENEDTEIITILENDVDFGRTLHSYGKEQSVNPIRFKINENCVDGRRIRLTISSTCENGTGETIAQDFVITVENGEELNGILAKNTTLEAGKHYIINKSFAVPNGITLTIPAGTTIKIHDGAMLVVSENARIRAIGTPDKPIVFTKGDLSQGYIPTLSFNSNCVFQYCQFLMLSGEENLVSGGRFTDCVFKDCYVGDHGLTGMTTTRCNIIQNTGYAGIEQGNTHKNSNIIGNTVTTLSGKCLHGVPWYKFLPEWKDFNACNIYGNSIDFLHSYANVACITTEPGVVYYDYPSYLGSALEENVRKTVMDYYSDLNDDVHFTTFGAVDLSNMLKQPNDGAHGVVWKVMVDGYDAQDEYDSLPPLGVGTHRVDVCFNREMDTLVTPYLAMGVRPPYTQTFVNENPSWSADGKTYTAYITITAKSAFDGINRFYVAEAQDLDHFVIPVERSRFSVPVSAAGSKSTGFMAQAGMGRVDLSWKALDAEEVEDVIGYNLYRFTMDEDGEVSDTLRVNPELLVQDDSGAPEPVEGGSTDMTFTDYDVVPRTTYYYYYRALRSTLDSTEPSAVVASTPLTAAKGDANGSMDVTVADVVAEINYLTGQNPQPFIFEAADVNDDSLLNILDVVGTINLVMGNAGARTSRPASLVTATYTIEDGILYIDSPVSLAGLQIQLTPSESDDEETLLPLADLQSMEYASCTTGTTRNFLAFSLARRSLASGHRAVLHVGDAQVLAIVLSDAQGNEVPVTYQVPTIVEYFLMEKAPDDDAVYDLMGRKVLAPGKGIYVINGKKVCF